MVPGAGIAQHYTKFCYTADGLVLNPRGIGGCEDTPLPPLSDISAIPPNPSKQGLGEDEEPLFPKAAARQVTSPANCLSKEAHTMASGEIAKGVHIGNDSTMIQQKMDKSSKRSDP